MFKKVTSVLLIIAICFSMSGVMVIESFAIGNTYYVSESGNDANSGTIASPFRTIAKASTVMTAGDTCIVRGGTYEESISPTISGTKDAPITYKAYDGETVTITGCDEITGWTQHSGNIYVAPITWDLGVKNNQVFVNKELMHLAQWPNWTGNDIFNPGQTSMDSGTATTITDTGLNKSDDYWVGGFVWVMGRWCAGVADITSSSGTTINFPKFKWSDTYTNPKAGRNFFIANVFGELDTEKEWYIDAANNKIYLWAPGGVHPNNFRVEAKRRQYGFDLNGVSYVNIEGFNLFGTSMRIQNSSHCMIKGINASYLSHTMDLQQHYTVDNVTGIHIGGDYNTLRDSTIKYSSGNGVVVTGTNNNIINNLLSHVNYNGTYNSGISINGGSKHLVSYNTAHTSGRDLMQVKNTGDNIIERNEFYNPCIMSWDSGAIYIVMEDLEGTEFRYNKIHNIRDHVNAIYMDGTVENIWIHHNTVWDVGSWHALNIGQPNNFVIAENNMFDGVVEVWDNWKYGSRLTNNVITESIDVKGGNGIVIENNKQSGFDKNAYGDAGHNFLNPPNPIFQHETPHLYRNRVSNGYFDPEVELRDWSKTGATSNVSFRRAEGDPLLNKTGFTRTGFGSVQLSAGGCGIEQVISGLEPNTTYELSGWGKSPNGATLKIGVVDFGDAEKYGTISNTGVNWHQEKIQFTTGENNTSAKIYGQNIGSDSFIGYVDDFSVMHVKSPVTGGIVNVKDDSNNIAKTGAGRTAVVTHDHFNNALTVMTDGIKSSLNSADSWNGQVSLEDYWGISFTSNYGFNKVVYNTSWQAQDGGWFDSNLRVQVNQAGKWIDVSNQTISPSYPYDSSAANNQSYTFTFDDTWGEAIRVIGTPVQVSGHNFTFTMVGEFEAYYMENDSSNNNIANVKDDNNNLAQTGQGRAALFVHDHFNNALTVMTDGIKSSSNSADSWNGDIISEDYWGISFSEKYGFNKVIYNTSWVPSDGGWFNSDLRVQVKQNGHWIDVAGQSMTPVYPYDSSAAANQTYTFNFDDTWGDAIRIIGVPTKVSGHNFSFTMIGEFEVYYVN